MKDVFKALLFLLLISSMLYLSIYKFQDCRKVGHSVMYCILDLD